MRFRCQIIQMPVGIGESVRLSISRGFLTRNLSPFAIRYAFVSSPTDSVLLTYLLPTETRKN
ncbi:hypothetical protein CCHR01_12658 [Colletotrichum chrysophilum]|uniref:Uncharacterized protein n=1 Tax=Colletotrichum chrysophilum TaxID=1836956 RepID=A0AAD9AAX3_9PEZI|nr:hypothetical protein CCHR01_12658 [Colletotrichum chrysophilum]